MNNTFCNTKRNLIRRSLQILYKAFKSARIAEYVIVYTDSLSYRQDKSNQPFVLVDYGAAEGSNGTFLFVHIIGIFHLNKKLKSYVLYNRYI